MAAASTRKSVSALGAITALCIIAIAVYRGMTNAGPAAPGAGTQPSETSPSDRSRDALPDTAPVTATAPASDESSQLRIGSWNIEWLGKPEERSGRARRVAQSMHDLADYIIFARVDLLALQEVVTRHDEQPIRSPQLEALSQALFERTGEQWLYVLFPGRSPGDQLTGVMWADHRVRPLGTDDRPWTVATDRPWALPIAQGRSQQGSRLWSRPPHAVKFRAVHGPTDFVIIPVHMKADYEGDFASHRADEARALVGALQAVRENFTDRDIIVLGDTNCVDGDEPALREFKSAGFADRNHDALRTHWQRGQMDKALVPIDQPEFQGSDFEVISDDYLNARELRIGEFKRRYSDHFMVVTTIAIGADDD